MKIYEGVTRWKSAGAWAHAYFVYVSYSMDALINRLYSHWTENDIRTNTETRILREHGCPSLLFPHRLEGLTARLVFDLIGSDEYRRLLNESSPGRPLSPKRVLS